MDDQLSFSDNKSDVCKKASRMVGVLRRLRKMIGCEAKLQLYRTAILPHLTYCHIVWHFCKQSDRRKLERVQERALRVVFNSKTESYEELLNRASLPSLYNRWLQDIAIVMFKVKNGIAPNYISDLFNSSSKGYSLRNADFNLPRFSTVRYGKHSLRYFGPWLWSRWMQQIEIERL